jgi:hypothetical protein
MNEKRAKAIRQAIIPGREVTGTSRGDFLRGTTKYEHKVGKRFIVERFKVMGKGQYLEEREDNATYEERTFDTYTRTLQEDCPRGMVQKFKRLAKNG